ncbi:MAG: FecR domain-containing protein [Steroidobacteraceae bacterium]|nr:FecR domain-containing protein [Steroidobacteraceae bacterium]
MSTLLAFPDYRKAREGASLWLARVDRGLSPSERTEMRQWLREPLHHRAMLEMARLWRGMDMMAVLPELFPLDDGPDRPPRRSFLSVITAAFSSVCIVVLLSALVSGSAPWNLVNASHMAMEHQGYGTVAGEIRTVPLRDGTQMTMNSNTAVAVLYSPRSRDVYLARGEASFSVARDELRPFYVHAGKRVLLAMGAVFNVRLLAADEVDLTVIEGRVKILPSTHGTGLRESLPVAQFVRMETTVSAQENAIVQSDAVVVRRLEPHELSERIAWHPRPH